MGLVASWHLHPDLGPQVGRAGLVRVGNGLPASCLFPVTWQLRPCHLEIKGYCMVA